MSNIMELAQELKKKWEYPSNDLSARLGIFFKQLNINSEERETLKELLQNFIYISEMEERKILNEFKKTIDKLDKSKTIYSYIEDKRGKLNSSNNILSLYKHITGLRNGYTLKIDRISDFEVDNLILFDDISGSGKTIEDFFKENLEIIKDGKITIYLFIYIISEEAKSKIEKYCKSIDLEINIIPYYIVKKCFQKGYIYHEDALEKRTLIKNHEETIGGDNKSYVLGFKESELLVAFYNTIPNNTLSSFWYETKKWNPLFKRDNSGPIRKKMDKKELSMKTKGYK